MTAVTSTSTSIASLVAQAADEFLDQLTRGETPDVADYARRYPQIASVLPQVLPAVRLIHEMAPGVTAPLAAPAPPDRLGEFRLRPRDRPRWDGGRLRGRAGLARPAGRLEGLAATAGVDARQLARFQIEAQVPRP